MDDFVLRSIHACLGNRTIFVFGSSVTRAFAFEAQSRFGGIDNDRKMQKEICLKTSSQVDTPGGKLSQGESCRIQFNGVDIRYTWIQNFERRLVEEYVTPALFFPPDFCGNVSTRECMEDLLKDSKPGDIMIFGMGLTYSYWHGDIMKNNSQLNFTNFLEESLLAWRETVQKFAWHGRQEDVIRIRVPPTKEILHVHGRIIPYINNAGDRIFKDTKWKVIDQFGINLDGKNYYTDGLHFGGPLHYIAWEILLSAFCPGIP